MNPTSAVANELQQNSEPIAKEMVNSILELIGVEIPKQEVDQAIIVYTEYLSFLGDSIMTKDETTSKRLLEWSKQNGEREAAKGGRISDILFRYPPTRIVFIDKMAEISLRHGVNTEDLIWINKRVNNMLDISINETVFAFERQTSQLMKEVQAEVDILSTPVVPVQENVAVLPLVGKMDHDRARLIMERAIPLVANQKIQSLIIDFSGIVTIDATIAKHIIDIHNVLRLLGVDSIATGMRPELAQAAVEGGVDFSNISTFATVKQAIDSINNKI
ncbi:MULTISPECIES: STAS domain-containing protein [Mesobacillus]|uniref:STAS domain-containing protein n=1 Tax=Mesobacillus TaxID=2675231 RepID=UPI00177DA82E|nr:STAS domain-containing protein [Mesobacillus jeotgali]MCM3575121.1 STAS domain-containing protein [Mesobacillus subterraneus]UYZ20157.1 STAS domain-containing protein [Mesobacillus jeotgali]